MEVITLLFEAPLQSWGDESLFENRKTTSYPTKSAITGLICAANGAERGGDKEKEIISILNNCKTEIYVMEQGEILEDYHTVDTNEKNNLVTRRYYIMDGKFGCTIEGKNLTKIETGLANPKWGGWLGRRCCIPSERIYRGKFKNKEEALKELGDVKLRIIEDENGTVTKDVAVDFEKRIFSSRKIIVEKIMKNELKIENETK